MPCTSFVSPLQVTALFRRAERQLKQLMAESGGLTQAEATVRTRILPLAMVYTIFAFLKIHVEMRFLTPNIIPAFFKILQEAVPTTDHLHFSVTVFEPLIGGG